MKVAGSLLLVSVLLGACAALAGAAIGLLTAATISPPGGALLGAAFGVSGGAFMPRPSRVPSVVLTVARAAIAGATGALVVALLHRQ